MRTDNSLSCSKQVRTRISACLTHLPSHWLCSRQHAERTNDSLPMKDDWAWRRRTCFGADAIPVEARSSPSFRAARSVGAASSLYQTNSIRLGNSWSAKNVTPRRVFGALRTPDLRYIPPIRRDFQLASNYDNYYADFEHDTGIIRGV